MLGPSLFFSTLCPFKLCDHLAGEDRAGCFALIAFLMAISCYCSLPFPHGAVGWSAVCDWGISWLYSLLYVFALSYECN